MFRQNHRLGRAAVVLAASIAVLAAAPAAAASESGSADKVARVKGGGSGVLTDPDGNTFPLDSFRVHAAVNDDGSAAGKVRFVWRGSFPEVWGDPACEGTCDTVVLKGEVESGSVAADGTVTLSGTAREVDKRGGEVVFDSDFDEPFSIEAGGSQGKDRFIVQWCDLPPFQIEGSIRVNTNLHDKGGQELTSALSANAACGSRGTGV